MVSFLSLSTKSRQPQTFGRLALVGRRKSLGEEHPGTKKAEKLVGVLEQGLKAK